MKIKIPGMELRITRFDSVENTNDQIKKMINPVVTKIKKRNKKVYITIKDSGKTKKYTFRNNTVYDSEIDHLIYIYNKDQNLAGGLSW